MENFNQEKFQQIYDNMKENSMGKEKTHPYNKTRKKVVLKVALTTLISTMAIASLVGCGYINNNSASKNETRQETKYDYSYRDYGYEGPEITWYSDVRFKTILEDNGLIEYTIDENNKYHYNYTAEDYKRIKGFDETYIYSAFELTDEKTKEEIVKACGYKDIQDYLTKKGYIKENGEIDNVKMKTDQWNTIVKILDKEVKGYKK